MKRASQLWELIEDLISTALGEKKADLVIRGADLINVWSGEIVEKVDIAVKVDRIAYVGSNASHTIGNLTKVINAEGKYVAPGFLDAHVHVESSMVTLTQFTKAVIPHGTTGAFIDPHEICNVLGVEGFRMMLKEAEKVPLRAYLQVPSCVPAASLEFETPGAILDHRIIAELISKRLVIALGEMMNFPGVLNRDKEVLEKIRATLKIGKIVTGHAPKLSDKELSAYISAGISSCHESTSKEEALEKLRRGMYVIAREGSAWRDVKDIMKIITENKVDTRNLLLATDDRHPEDLINEGHMDFVIRRAIEEGIDPVRAIQMATINVATYYGLWHDVGVIAPGRYADLVLLDDLSNVRVFETFIGGELIAREGKLVVEIGGYRYPEHVKRTIKLPRSIKAEDLKVTCKIREGNVKVHVIEIIEAKTLTKHLIETLPIREYTILPSIKRDIISAAVIERHKGTGNIGKGFVKGLGLRSGAFASSVAHDSHNIVVVGVSYEDMALAVNKLAEVGGGMIAVEGGKVRALVNLPVAGLMSEKSVEEVAEEVTILGRELQRMGCKIRSPFMTISLLALTVLPEIRLSDKGLIDVIQGRIIDVIAE